MEAVYLDYNATTPLDPEILEKMMPYLREQFGNASSASHQWGWAAGSAVKKARAQIANLIGAKEHEIFFTAGATESNNMTIFGLIRQLREQDPAAPVHIISTEIEHPSVLEALKYARQNENVEVDFLPVDREGVVSIKAIESAIRPHTRLISVIWVQNEIGSIQNLAAIGKLAHEKKIYFHSDATQGLGKIPLDVEGMSIDLLSGSAHKFYGPKGIGFLYKRSQAPRVQIQPLIFGGDQESGLRSGTSNVAGIVGLGAAAEKCQRLMREEKKFNEEMRSLLWKLLSEKIPGLRLNGPPLENRSPVNLNLTFPGTAFLDVIPQLPQIGMSAGSACHSGSWSYSPTLKAIGVSEEEARSTLRLSWGRGTTESQIRQATQKLWEAAKV